MRRLRAGDLLPPGVSAGLVDLLRLNTDLSMVAAAFALDPLAHVDVDVGVRLFNKTGTDIGTRADVACAVVALMISIGGGFETFRGCRPLAISAPSPAAPSTGRPCGYGHRR